MRVCLALLLALALAACARGNPAADFTLQDDAGNPWSLSAQRGKAVVVTFGYTHCTDTCPVTLAKLAQAMHSLGDRAKNVEVVFVTVDPQRDTPAVLRAYLQKFDPRFVGLGGTLRQVVAVEEAYHVWAQRIPGKHGEAGYDDAHSSAIFFVDTHGNAVALHDGGDSVEELARAAAIALG